MPVVAAKTIFLRGVSGVLFNDCFKPISNQMAISCNDCSADQLTGIETLQQSKEFVCSAGRICFDSISIEFGLCLKMSEYKTKMLYWLVSRRFPGKPYPPLCNFLSLILATFHRQTTCTGRFMPSDVIYRINSSHFSRVVWRRIFARHKICGGIVFERKFN